MEKGRKKESQRALMKMSKMKKVTEAEGSGGG
jgi:hypothetical protein